MTKKLTDKQKLRLWQQFQRANFQASNRLEGYDIPLLTLPAEAVLARIAELRGLYER